MKTINFYKNNELKLGVKTNDGIIDVEAVLETKYGNKRPDNIPVNTEQLIHGDENAKQSLEKLINSLKDDVHYLEEQTLTFGPCVLNPQKIVCVGLNYRRHAEESGMSIPTKPILFSKFNNSLSGHKEKIPLPERSVQVDYEAELAIVIGRKAKNVRKNEALSYVYGYCNANDLSARDLQMESSQWLLGKTCDGFCPLGPYLVSKDEVDDPNNLRIEARVNGEIRQSSNTSDMIFYCDEIISYISQHMTLYPGDVILTGTPEGVILGYNKHERVWLSDGDEVTIEVEKLGRLTNTLIK